MNDEEAFDAELDSLEQTLDRARLADSQLHAELEAVKRRFEESELWLEHKQWHEKQGTQAKLTVQEAEVPVVEQQQQATSEASPHRKLVRFGVCQCQPYNALLQLDDKGQVVASVPAVEEPAAYGLSSGSATTEYDVQNNQSTTYQIDPALNKDLYR
jgi:hypothetical protein